jgi:hypothetical protein
MKGRSIANICVAIFCLFLLKSIKRDQFMPNLGLEPRATRYPSLKYSRIKGARSTN